MGSGASATLSPRTLAGGALDRHAVPSRELIVEALAAQRYIPCEAAGPHAMGAYHSNTTGRFMGFASAAAFDGWFAAESAKLAAFGSWDGWHASENALAATDPDFTMMYGHHVLGGNFDLWAARPRLDAQRSEMEASYLAAVRDATAPDPELLERLMMDEALASRPPPPCGGTEAGAGGGDEGGDKGDGKAHINDNNKLQPHTTVDDLYRGSLEALHELCEIARDAAAAGSEAEATREGGGDSTVGSPTIGFTWSMKTLLRVEKKMVERYNRQVNHVSDVARASIVFPSCAGLLAGFDHVCVRTAEGGDWEGRLVTVKNRFREPCYGYSDVLLNLVCSNGTVVELQLHLKRIYEVKGESGHGLFKWIRRMVLEDDIYEGEESTDDVHKLKSVSGKPVPHGQGTMRWISGAKYTGAWDGGLRHGQGVYTFADGDE